MSWRDLLETPGEIIVSPWLGGRRVHTWVRSFVLDGDLPAELGWYAFTRAGARSVRLAAPSVERPEQLRGTARGYLVGDRLVPDDVRVGSARDLARRERVFLIEPGLDRFARVSAGRPCAGGPLVYRSLEFPLGPIPGLRTSSQRRRGSVSGETTCRTSRSAAGSAPALRTPSSSFIASRGAICTRRASS